MRMLCLPICVLMFSVVNVTAQVKDAPASTQLRIQTGTNVNGFL
jgi:hypothetical protein